MSIPISNRFTDPVNSDTVLLDYLYNEGHYTCDQLKLPYSSCKLDKLIFPQNPDLKCYSCQVVFPLNNEDNYDKKGDTTIATLSAKVFLFLAVLHNKTIITVGTTIFDLKDTDKLKHTLYTAITNIRYD